MIVALPISLNDQELTLKNVHWWQELGGCKGHECLFIPDARCSIAPTITAALNECFDHVYVFPARAEIDGWPEGANYMFRTATAWLANSPKWKYFMWMEPDAIPMEAGWLTTIENEYQKCGKPFMGDRVQVEDIPLHMSGVGVYPNPLHAYAGEAYRAADIAWDMAGREQIISRAHFTKLIEHAWKHPSFKDERELSTQMRQETILFHASKDGSLIDLLQGKRRGKQLSQSSIVVKAQPEKKEPEEPGSPSPQNFTCDIFIRTYRKDYDWLYHCLRSINEFCTGFRKIAVVSPEEPPVWLLPEDGIEWKQMNDETEDGYLAQQITKLYADVILDYQPDYILHLDSDVVFTRNTTPQDFFDSKGKLLWLYTPYSEIETPWQPVTEKFMCEKPENEFMRRFPIMIPRWVYPRIREFCHIRHGMVISQYVRSQPARAFSEFNAIGAYCFKYHQDKFHWVNTVRELTTAPCARQFRSWDGITPEVKKELASIFGGNTETSPTAGAGEAVTGDSLSLPHGVKELKNGLWVIKDDTHISKWIEQQGRLDHDQNSLPFILPLIKEGDVVIDAGAFVGDHTIAYSKAVGKKGIVHAFEPNPVAYECMVHNLEKCHNVIMHDVGLSNTSGSMPLSGNNNNYGGCYTGEHMKIADVTVQSLDEWFYLAHINFIKLDIEGCEVKALIGAQKLIERCHPTMVIEVNQVALERQGNTVGQLFALLESHGYTWSIMQENCSADSPMYDIICMPPSPEVPDKVNGERGSIVVPPSPPPVASPSPIFDMLTAIAFLKAFADTSPKHRQRLMINLSKNGLTPRHPRKNKHGKTTANVSTKKEVETTPAAAPIRKGKRSG